VLRPPCFLSSIIHIVSVAMAALLIASFVMVASAKSFLDAKVGASSVERALLSELSGLAHAAQLAHIDDELRPMYDALPKNQHGRLDSVSVRYALHRYFMQKHGWYVNGLGAANNTEEQAATIMKDRAPAFIQSLFEQRLEGQGLSRHDLAVFAATLTDLIHNEVGGDMERVYAALELPTAGPVTEREFEVAAKAYLLTYLSGGRAVVSKMEEVSTVERRWDNDYPAWQDTWEWALDLKGTVDLQEEWRRNPFVERKRTFEEQVSFLQEFGHRLGTFQNLECHKLKDQLVELEDVGTGRVPLSRFYRGGVDGEWQFTESVDYLRHIGALDESNPKRMSVVIPNYIQSESNCLAGSSFYSVCCFNECEGLLGHVEQAVGAPSSRPSELAAIVSNLQSDTVFAPRNLSRALLDRLGDIAHLHGGSVPLHGRLFAQWMHHAYPRECPFPHAIGATNRMSSEEWMDAMEVESAEATEEEMFELVSQDTLMPEIEAEALPWTMAEELVAGHLALGEVAPSASAKYLRFCVAMLILVSLMAPLSQRAKSTATCEGMSKAERYVV